MTALDHVKLPEAMKTVPPLHVGDRLTRFEFERRYVAMPHLKKAELVEGVVYLGGRVKIDEHAAPLANLVTWLGYYKAFTVGLQDS